MDIVEKIREQIAQHRAEILRLESALEVIAEMGGKQAKKDQPMITVRKVINHDAEPPKEKKPRAKHKVQPAEIDARIVAHLKAHGPSRSIDIGHAIGISSKRLWSRLWYLNNKAGTVIKEEDGVYRLPEAAPGAQEEAA